MTCECRPRRTHGQEERNVKISAVRILFGSIWPEPRSERNKNTHPKKKHHTKQLPNSDSLFQSFAPHPVFNAANSILACIRQTSEKKISNETKMKLLTLTKHSVIWKPVLPFFFCLPLCVSGVLFCPSLDVYGVIFPAAAFFFLCVSFIFRNHSVPRMSTAIAWNERFFLRCSCMPRLLCPYFWAPLLADVCKYISLIVVLGKRHIRRCVCILCCAGRTRFYFRDFLRMD